MFTSLTTHNLHFHEDASIFSCASKNNLLATGGGDTAIRIWKLEYTKKSPEFNYYTSLNSPLKITYMYTLSGHTKTINSLEFTDEHLLSSSDAGEVFLWPIDKFEENKYYKIRGADGDEAIVALMLDKFVYVGMKSGQLYIYELIYQESVDINDDVPIQDSFTNENEKESMVNNESKIKKVKVTLLSKENTPFKVKLVKTLKLHSDSIQGMCINQKHSILFTQSKDKSMKTVDLLNHKVINTLYINKLITENTALKEQFKEEIKFEFSDRSFFKKCIFIDDTLYLTNVSINKKNVLISLEYPYRTIAQVVGIFNWPVQRILKLKDTLVLCTLKSIYILKNKCEMISNVGYGAMTDGCLIDEGIIFSNTDGFMYSLML
ncbi:hypothetical protein H312_03063, partial [Anncaliia algerae PRA339]